MFYKGAEFFPSAAEYFWPFWPNYLGKSWQHWPVVLAGCPQ